MAALVVVSTTTTSPDVDEPLAAATYARVPLGVSAIPPANAPTGMFAMMALVAVLITETVPAFSMVT